MAFLLVCLAFLPASAQDFVTVKASKFVRGAAVADSVLDAGRSPDFGADWDEGPPHEVKISEFAIATRQVSMQEFAEFLPAYKQRLLARFIEFKPDAPAVFVSWNEASAYCEWLSRRKNRAYRLPTEAEWELAAANVESLKLKGIADGTREWCLDWWAPYLPGEENVLVDPMGPATGTVRVLRDGGGGSVEEKMAGGEIVTDFRITDRSATLPDDRRANIGFRIAAGALKKRADEIANELHGAPFKDVSVEKYEWGNVGGKTEPYFWAGGKFIDVEPEAMASLPYWNRHHVPSLTWCDNGDLLATVFTAPFDNSDQMAVLITRLRAGQEKWDAPTRFFIAPDHNVTAATLFNAGDGTIHHYNGLGNNHCQDFSMLKRVSRDNGATWSQPRIVHRFPAFAATSDNLFLKIDYGLSGFRASSNRRPFCKPRLWPHMDLKAYVINGERQLLMSTDVGDGNDLGSAIFRSKDEGESWEEITRIGWNPGDYSRDGKSAGWIAGIHASFELLHDGSLLAIGRSSDINGFSPMSVSGDFGKTWRYAPSPFPAILSGQRSAMIRLKEGPLLFMSFTDYAKTVRDGNAKGMKMRDAKGDMKTGVGMFAALSFDEGKTWPKRKLIPNWIKRPWKSRSSGYLSSVQTPDGMIHLVSSRFYYRFNLAWLKELPE